MRLFARPSLGLTCHHTLPITATQHSQKGAIRPQGSSTHNGDNRQPPSESPGSQKSLYSLFLLRATFVSSSTFTSAATPL